MPKLNEYALTAEAAQILGVCQNTLRAWANAGKIRTHRNPANHNRMFRRTDLEKFLDKAAQPVRAMPSKKPK